MNIEEKRVNRYKFLWKVHDLTNGNEQRIVNMWDVGSELDWDRQQTEVVIQYLVGEGLIKHWTLGGGIGITHHGIKQYEYANTHPEKETEYFPPVINVFSGDFTGAIVNLQSIFQSVAQEINSSEAISDDERSQLVSKLNDLSTQLSNLPPELSEEAEAISWAATGLARESSKRDPNSIRFETLINGLKNAIPNIIKVAPNITKSVSDLISIASTITKIR